MNIIDRLRLQTFQKELLSQHKIGSPESLGWASSESQIIRFQILSQIDHLSNTSILDLGCGYGDFKLYLDQFFQNIQYTGIDMMPDFLEKAFENIGNLPNVKLFHANFSEIELPKTDYVMASGIFCYKSQIPDDHQNMIKKMFESAQKGIAFNMLDSKMNFSEHFIIGHDIDEIMDFCKTLSPKLTLKTAYLTDDFTIFLKK
ncbi:MAG: class I SAM-dependent methyltransferase [Bacteroidetes bacterium]|nr:MAG: class I SAM-dependent methyltransferase [Bacteroidota bacterium]